MNQHTRESRWSVRKRLNRDLLEHLCLLRGFSADDLQPDYSAHLHDPNLLPDMVVARRLIRQAVENGSHVTIFGDYDADGTPASALLSMTLTKINVPHDVMLPTRSTGYGLHCEQVEEIIKRSKLLITVDTGINSLEEIKMAKDAGLGVIVLDHHLPGPELPVADAIIDPHRKDSTYPFAQLCGCALAFKLVCALVEDFHEITKGYCKWLLDLVAISTVADMMPLVGENRALVHYGLVVLRQNRRVGLQALLEEAGVQSDSITSSTIGFIIGPRLNASGRLSDNTPALRLLLTEDKKKAKALAKEIEQANVTRQSLVDEVLSEAREQLFKQNDNGDRIFTLFGRDWPSGVVGLVAGRLVFEYSRPVIVGSLQNGEIRASARSIEKYSIVDGLTRCATHLGTFGGHAQAAGLSTNASNWEKLSSALKRDAVNCLDEHDLVKRYVAEAFLEKSDLTTKVASSLEKLAPFGLGNTKPLLILRDADVADVRFIGSDARHLKMLLNSALGNLEVIGFDLADRYKQQSLKSGNFLGYLENNYFQGAERLQLRLVDFQPREAVIELA
ncbi:MAG: single-stranded-DNA-specific exonuclease RecJ [Candidatus Berkelbacteria bacterium]|nr:MAG: single-stranded-DNA-specific exonuclease RecJ [Candidatus Berkelbacteria bacterium]QQG51484.1 MAG: single-stranded-DNA-specific exonuclease RecJ [Candidatus Berkelbacteria bacterium]